MQQTAYQERKKRERQRRLYRRDIEHFYFASAESRYRDLRPATVARLVYLASYIGYDGRLKLTHRSTMKRENLQNILCVSQAETYRFWNEVKGKYIFEDKDRELSMPDTFFCCGELSRCSGQYQQFYVGAVRELYQKTPQSKHKYLGYVFQMLPFINIEYNVLCHNPEETNLDRVELLTLNEFCELVGYSSVNRANLVREYSKIIFPVGDHQECFCSFVTNCGNIGTAQIFVNPHIIYHGNNNNMVAVLGKFCNR
jgi:hypothetical protein